MRFDTPVYFQRIVAGKYNADTGNYDDDTVSEVMHYASVTNTGTETLKIAYGEIKQGSLTIRVQNRLKEPFDRIRIGNKIYRVDMSRQLLTKHTFVVSEVQGNAEH